MGLAFRCGEIEDHASFALVPREERWADTSERVAGGLLNLDDVGPEHGEVPADDRPGDERREVDGSKPLSGRRRLARWWLDLARHGGWIGLL